MASSYPRAFVIFNPASGRGRGQRRIGLYLRLLERHLPFFDYAVTAGPGDEALLADRVLAQGYDPVIAVGGDGTWSHVADRILASERPGVRLGLLPAGTGNDFGRGLGLDFADPEAAVRALADGRVLRVDVGRVLTPSVPSGGPGPSAAGRAHGDGHRGNGLADAGAVARHFLNVIGFGFDVAVIDAATRARFLKGELLYKVTAFQQLFRFPGIDFTLSDADEGRAHGRHLMLTISNGRYFGGGFPIAPLATVQDGLLHACRIGDASPLTRMRLFNQASTGRHVTSPRVEVRSSRAFRVEFRAPVRFEIDGDVFLASAPTVRVESLPGALQVLAP